jgi:hypothetical protein
VIGKDDQDFNNRAIVFSLLDSCSKRLARMKTTKTLRDADGIWEAYCDVEMAIGLSKAVFHRAIKVGTPRRLVSQKKGFLRTATDIELEERYSRVDSAIVDGQFHLENGLVEEGIEFLRMARDELKILLLSAREKK